jgi:hypothetical protein
MPISREAFRRVREKAGFLLEGARPTAETLAFAAKRAGEKSIPLIKKFGQTAKEKGIPVAKVIAEKGVLGAKKTAQITREQILPKTGRFARKTAEIMATKALPKMKAGVITGANTAYEISRTKIAPGAKQMAIKTGELLTNTAKKIAPVAKDRATTIATILANYARKGGEHLVYRTGPSAVERAKDMITARQYTGSSKQLAIIARKMGMKPTPENVMKLWNAVKAIQRQEKGLSHREITKEFYEMVSHAERLAKAQYLPTTPKKDIHLEVKPLYIKFSDGSVVRCSRW